MFEIMKSCYAVPYRNKRCLKFIKIPAGAIVEEATPESIATHVPGCSMRGTVLIACPPSYLELPDHQFVAFAGYALINTGDVALLYGE